MNFPKFLYAKEGKRHFLIHTEFPAFIGEYKRNGKYYDMVNPTMLENFPMKAGDEKFLAALMREGGIFFSKRIKVK